MMQLNIRKKYLIIGMSVFIVAAIISLYAFKEQQPEKHAATKPGTVGNLNEPPGQVAGVSDYDELFLNPIAFNVPDYWKQLPIKLGDKISGTFADIQLQELKAQLRMSTAEGWVELSLLDGNDSPAEVSNNKVYYTEVYPDVDIDIRAYDGLLRQLVTLNTESANTELAFKFVADSQLKLAPITGGYVPVVRKDTGEEVFMLRTPQGIGINGVRVDYEYSIGKTQQRANQFETEISLKPARSGQLQYAQFPVKIDASIQAVAWDEALVKVGENGYLPGNARDGDVISIKPAGWNWGIEERKSYVIVRVPRDMQIGQPDNAVKTSQEATRYGIDYTKLSTPQELQQIRNVNIQNPVLDATAHPEVIIKKANPLSSVIPDSHRLAYQVDQLSLFEKIFKKIFKPVQAVTIVTSSIGTSSRDYSTIQAWETARDGDLVTRASIEKGLIYNDSVFDEEPVVSGSTTNSTYYMWLTVASNDRHDGLAGTGARIVSADASTGIIFQVVDGDAVIEWLEITESNARTSALRVGGADKVVVRNLLIHDMSGSGNVFGVEIKDHTGEVEVYNNIIYDIISTGANAYGMQVDSTEQTSIKLFNNTIYNIETQAASNAYGISAWDVAALEISNNIVADMTTSGGSAAAFDRTWNNASENYNLITDSSGTGSNTLENQTVDTLFINIEDRNLHLVRGSAAVDAGTSQAGLFTVDIDGGQRSGNWDIGADEMVCDTTDWWHCNWTKRRKITLDNSAQGTSLSNFPAAVLLNKNRLDYLHASTSDIRFVDADNKTMLYHEVERWDETSTTTLWVQVPQIDTTGSDYIWMYYGAGETATSSNASTTAVWNNGYIMVQHLSEPVNTTAGGYNDSSGGRNHGTGSSMALAETAGITGYAQDFDGTADQISITDNASLRPSTGPFTLSVWFRAPDASQLSSIFSKTDPTDGVPNTGFGISATDLQSAGQSISTFYGNDSTSNYEDWWPNNDATDDAWHHASLVISSGSGTLYYDGAVVSKRIDLGSPNPVNTDPWLLGGTLIGGAVSYYFDGLIDEARLSATNRSADWVSFEYCNIKDTCVSYGPEETQQISAGIRFR